MWPTCCESLRCDQGGGTLAAMTIQVNGGSHEVPQPLSGSRLRETLENDLRRGAVECVIGT